jgi:hypothetical protein
MTRRDESIRPMTLGNMRQNGVRELYVTCSACGYHAEVNFDTWPDDVPVPSFGPRMPTSLTRARPLLGGRLRRGRGSNALLLLLPHGQAAQWDTRQEAPGAIGQGQAGPKAPTNR